METARNHTDGPMKVETRGRKPKNPKDRIDIPKKFYVDEATDNEILEAFAKSGFLSESAFIRHLIDLGLEAEGDQSH